MWLKGHIKSKLVMDCCKRDMDQFDFFEYSWTCYYPVAAVVIPDDMPCPLGSRCGLRSLPTRRLQQRW